MTLEEISQMSDAEFIRYAEYYFKQQQKKKQSKEKSK